MHIYHSCVATGRAEPFNESAAQVQRLVSRDRKEFLGNKVDILDKYQTEFGDPDDDTPASASASTPAASSSSVSTSSPSAPASSTSVASPFAATATAAKPAAVQTKFTGGSSTASPFGSAARTRSIVEPKGLSPDMGPDPIVKPAATPGNFLSRITLTQVVSVRTGAWGLFASLMALVAAVRPS